MPTPSTRNPTILGILLSRTEETVLRALIAEKSIKGAAEAAAMSQNTVMECLKSLKRKHSVCDMTTLINLYCNRVHVPVMENDIVFDEE